MHDTLISDPYKWSSALPFLCGQSVSGFPVLEEISLNAKRKQISLEMGIIVLIMYYKYGGLHVREGCSMREAMTWRHLRGDDHMNLLIGNGH